MPRNSFILCLPQIVSSVISHDSRCQTFVRALDRVLARFVLKYTLTAGFQPPCLHEVVEGWPGHTRYPCNCGPRDAGLEELADFLFPAIKALHAQRSLRPPGFLSRCPGPGKSFPGAFGDEVALDLGEEGKQPLTRSTQATDEMKILARMRKASVLRRRLQISVDDLGTPSPHKGSICYEKEIDRFSIYYGNQTNIRQRIRKGVSDGADFRT